MNALRDFAKSISHAWQGLVLAFRTERSFRVQTVVAVGVIIVVFVIPFRSIERALLLLATATVLVLELVNSMVERLIDLVKPRMHAYVRDIKDLMAAAVLLASVFSLLLGILILWPYLPPLIGRL